MMLAHIIQHKGKGGWVLGAPLICGVVLFILSDAVGVDTPYIRPVCFFISAAIVWFVDDGHHLIQHGHSTNKRQNTFMWIDMKYWAIPLAIAGAIFLATIK